MVTSIQKLLNRKKHPKVKITYDVESSGEVEQLELPFVVGIIADLTGEFSPDIERESVRVRQLVDIDQEKFDTILASCMPRVDVSNIPNVLPRGGGKLSGFIEFQKFDDFEPMALLVQNNEHADVSYPLTPLQSIYLERNRLRTLQSKYDSSDALTKILDMSVSFERNVKADGSPDSGTIGDAIRAELRAAYLENQPDSWAHVKDEGLIHDLLDILLRSNDRNSETEIQDSKQLIGQFCNDILNNLDEGKPFTVENLINQHVSQTDKAIGRQLDLILHSDGFQKIEATWRGLHYLVFNTDSSSALNLRVMNVRKEELFKDMDRAVETSFCRISQLLEGAERNPMGEAPYSLLIADYEFSRNDDDTLLLNKISEVAAARHTPFIAAAQVPYADQADFQSQTEIGDLNNVFGSNELELWRAFREGDESRFVTLTVQRVLLRLPYGENTIPVDGIGYEENVDLGLDPVTGQEIQKPFDLDKENSTWGEKPIAVETSNAAVASTDGRKLLWGNAAYILAERITHAFSLYNWTAAINGIEGGGLIEGLPVFDFRTANGEIRVNAPTQIAISDSCEKEMNELGFIGIHHISGHKATAYFGDHQAGLSVSELRDSDVDKISTTLQYILAASRFAQYIKVVMWERNGAFMTKDNVEAYLNGWIAQYILLDEGAAEEVKAAYPLRDANITVADIPSKPGAFKVTLSVQPQYQLEKLPSPVRLEIAIPT